MLSAKRRIQLSRDVGAYLVLAAVVIAARIALSIWPTDAAYPSQASVLRWPVIFGVLLFGYVGVWLAPRAGLPRLMATEITNARRFGLASLAGMVLALPIVVIDLLYVLPEGLNVAFPHSIPFYLLGGVYVEVTQHLLPVAVLVWLISTLLLRGRAQRQVFWIVAVLVALIEPVGQLAIEAFESYPGHLYIVAGVVIFAANLTQMDLFRRYGFMAMLMFRMGLYLIWHIVWGQVRLELLFN